MIATAWKTPNDPVTITAGVPINVEPGKIGSQEHIITLDESAEERDIYLRVDIPGPAINPDITINPGEHFMSNYPQVKVDGVDFDFRRNPIHLKPGVPVKYEIFIGLLHSAPWKSMFIVQVYRNAVLENQ